MILQAFAQASANQGFLAFVHADACVFIDKGLIVKKLGVGNVQ